MKIEAITKLLDAAVLLSLIHIFHTPKIVAAGAEGGANIFKLEYFHQKAFLAQSQMCIRDSF